MCSNGVSLVQRLIVGLAFLSCIDDTIAESFDNAIFVQNHLRQCSGEMSCVGGDPTIEVDSDSDLGTDGSAASQILGPTLGTQSAISAGYSGNAFAPSISAYAYTEGPVRYTLGVFGLQRYEFLENGDVTIGGSLTFSQSGQTPPSSQNARGRLDALFMAFQMDGDVFDPSNCNIYNIFSGPGAFNESGFISSCLRFDGQFRFGTVVDFIGLNNYQESVFNIGRGPVVGGNLNSSLTVSGSAGDVFFLAASLGGGAHLGGFWDSANTLVFDFDVPKLVQASFAEETFVPAPTRMVNVDIKPGSESNCLNINGHGVIPVAILGSNTIDVAAIDSASLKFGGLAVGIRGRRGPHCAIEYVNEDQYPDLVCHFEDDPSYWSPGDGGTASVYGSLFDGREVTGTDTVCLVP